MVYQSRFFFDENTHSKAIGVADRIDIVYMDRDVGKQQTKARLKVK